MENGKPNSAVSHGLERLLNIDWGVEDDPEIYAALAGEYIRRVALMAENHQLNLTSPFFNPATVISIEGRTSSNAMARFLEVCNKSSALKNAYVRRCCECFLQWCEGIDLGDAIATANPDLFDPLIYLFERGGNFGLHHGELMVGQSAIPLQNWKRFVDAKPMNR